MIMTIGGGTPAEPDQPEPGDTPRPVSPEPPHKPPAKGEAQADMPVAGPHATPDLTDAEKTPGTGVLPDPGDDAMDSTSS